MSMLRLDAVTCDTRCICARPHATRAVGLRAGGGRAALVKRAPTEVSSKREPRHTGAQPPEPHQQQGNTRATCSSTRAQNAGVYETTAATLLMLSCRCTSKCSNVFPARTHTTCYTSRRAVTRLGCGRHRKRASGRNLCKAWPQELAVQQQLYGTPSRAPMQLALPGARHACRTHGRGEGGRGMPRLQHPSGCLLRGQTRPSRSCDREGS